MKSPGQPATGAAGVRVPRRHGGSGRWTRCLPAPLMRRSSCASRFRWICVPGDLPGTNYVNQYGEEMPSYSYASEACSATNRRTGDRGGRGGGLCLEKRPGVIGYHIGVEIPRMARPGIWRRTYRLLPGEPVQRFSAFLAERYGTDGALQPGRSGGFAGGRPLIPRRLAGHGMPRKCCHTAGRLKTAS